jgi:hypothetical protein
MSEPQEWPADAGGPTDASATLPPVPRPLDDYEHLADHYLVQRGANARLQEWQRQVGDYSLNYKKFLVISGPPSCGKTMLARQLCGDSRTLEISSVPNAARDLPMLGHASGHMIIFDEMPLRFMVRNRQVMTSAYGPYSEIRGDYHHPVRPVSTFGTDIIVTCSTWDIRMTELTEDEATWLHANSLIIMIRT